MLCLQYTLTHTSPVREYTFSTYQYTQKLLSTSTAWDHYPSISTMFSITCSYIPTQTVTYQSYQYTPLHGIHANYAANNHKYIRIMIQTNPYQYLQYISYVQRPQWGVSPGLLLFLSSWANLGIVLGIAKDLLIYFLNAVKSILSPKSPSSSCPYFFFFLDHFYLGWFGLCLWVLSLHFFLIFITLWLLQVCVLQESMVKKFWIFKSLLDSYIQCCANVQASWSLEETSI